jgi:hypothetical protein
LDNYQKMIHEGLTEKAFFELGMALHPLMDSTSPAHEGFQVWEGYWGNGALTHWAQEQTITNDRLSKTIELIKHAIE